MDMLDLAGFSRIHVRKEQWNRSNTFSELAWTNVPTDDDRLKATTGVGEAHLLQAYKPCVIGAIPTKTYCDWIASMTQGL